MDRRQFLLAAAGVASRSATPQPGAPQRPAHHDPEGGFRNPWPTARRAPGGVARWQIERLGKKLPPNPTPEQLPFAESRIAYPRARPDELRVTWIGHSSFLLQVGGYNLLTDPHFSRRASPVQWAGPSRLVPPGVPFEKLPPIDAVLLSHDHYDHLDASSVERLHATYGDALRWFTPLEYHRWFAARGIRQLSELDWWDTTFLTGAAGPLRISALPAQHWTSRSPRDRQQRLWCSWALTTSTGHKLYFGGDSGWFPDYDEIGRRAGPFQVVILPIGAYEPRWFMRPMHMNPEEAVHAYKELGGQGLFIAMHWGTFRLTDEDPLEPPQRLRSIWKQRRLPQERLCVLRHGETAVVDG